MPTAARIAAHTAEVVRRDVTALIDFIGDSVEEADEAQTLLLPPPRGSFEALVGFQLLMAALRTRQAQVDPVEGSTPDKLEEQGWDALAAGELNRALHIGDELLQRSRDLPEDDWNFGNLLHDGHIIRGYALLRGEDVAGAKAELRAAGKTPGSPQLDSFGPRSHLGVGASPAGPRPSCTRVLPGHITVLGPDRFA